MDGFAVIANDVKGADESYPVRLLLAGGSIPAGKVSSDRVDPGFCIPIMTGAAIPKGADSVVMKEDVQRDGKSILVFREVTQGENVRYRGEDIKKADIVLKKVRYNKSSCYRGPCFIGNKRGKGIPASHDRGHCHRR